MSGPRRSDGMIGQENLRRYQSSEDGGRDVLEPSAQPHGHGFAEQEQRHSFRQIDSGGSDENGHQVIAGHRRASTGPRALASRPASNTFHPAGSSSASTIDSPPPSIATTACTLDEQTSTVNVRNTNGKMVS